MLAGNGALVPAISPEHKSQHPSNWFCWHSPFSPEQGQGEQGVEKQGGGVGQHSPSRSTHQSVQQPGVKSYPNSALLCKSSTSTRTISTVSYLHYCDSPISDASPVQ